MFQMAISWLQNLINKVLLQGNWYLFSNLHIKKKYENGFVQTLNNGKHCLLKQFLVIIQDSSWRVALRPERPILPLHVSYYKYHDRIVQSTIDWNKKVYLVNQIGRLITKEGTGGSHFRLWRRIGMKVQFKLLIFHFPC